MPSDRESSIATSWWSERCRFVTASTSSPNRRQHNWWGGVFCGEPRQVKNIATRDRAISTSSRSIPSRPRPNIDETNDFQKEARRILLSSSSSSSQDSFSETRNEALTEDSCHPRRSSPSLPSASKDRYHCSTGFSRRLPGLQIAPANAKSRRAASTLLEMLVMLCILRAQKAERGVQKEETGFCHPPIDC